MSLESPYKKHGKFPERSQEVPKTKKKKTFFLAQIYILLNFFSSSIYLVNYFHLTAFSQSFVWSWLFWFGLTNVCSGLENVCVQPNNQPPSFFYRSIGHVLI